MRRRTTNTARIPSARRLAAILALAGVPLALSPADDTAKAAPPDAIRVGGPSAPGDAKVAIIASRGSLAGARFRVERNGKTVWSGRLQRAAGSAAPWAHAYRADLSKVRTPGAYRVRVGSLVSRPWTVTATGSSSLIPHLLKFFRTNRDGTEPALLHGPSHLNDAVVKGGPHDGVAVDLVGGWMDAGDMIKFTQTTGFSTALLLASARLDPANRAALVEEAGVGVRWLSKAHPFADLFVTQVGGVVDHSLGFRDPAGDDASPRLGVGTRFAFHDGTGVGGDIAGKVAAALALAAEAEPSASSKAVLVQAAREWYAAGRAAARATPKIAETGGFYTFETWQGSMAAGAAALFRATGEQSFLAEALAYLQGSSKRERYSPIEAAGMGPFAAADICGALGAPPLGDAGAQQQACRYLRDGASTAAEYTKQNAFAPFSYFQWGTTAVNAGVGAQAALAAAAAGYRQGLRFAAGARDYMLGRNAWGASFVAGFGPRSPKLAHHWASVFPPKIGLPEGAVVGGPAPREQVLAEHFGRPGGKFRAFNSDIVYEDRRADYVTSEPAIDAVASSILLLAALGPH